MVRWYRRPALVFAGAAALALAATGLGYERGWLAVGSFAEGREASGRPWYGAEQPEVRLHAYTDYACPHCGHAAKSVRELAREHRGTLRVIRHHQPRMQCFSKSPGVARTLEATDERCFFARLAVCAGNQDAFWRADVWLFAQASLLLRRPAHERLQKAAAELDLDASALLRCMGDAATFKRVQHDVDEALSHGIRSTPTYRIDDQILTGLELKAELSATEYGALPR